MANKTITQVGEKVTPDLTDVLLIEDTNASPVTFKTKIVNLLKRVFTFDDVYDDYLVSGLNLVSVGGNSAPTFREFTNRIYLYSFDNGAQIQEGHFTYHIQHDIKPNTDATIHIHWAHNNANPSGNIKWNVEYSVAKGYEFGDFSTTNVGSTIQAAGAQYAHHITNDDDIIISGENGELEPDTIIVGRIWRDATDEGDTFEDDAFLLHLDLHYVKSRTGTTERNRPFTSGGFS